MNAKVNVMDLSAKHKEAVNPFLHKQKLHNTVSFTCMSHNENFIEKSVGVTRSSKFQASQVQLLITAISAQIIGENTMILLTLL